MRASGFLFDSMRTNYAQKKYINTLYENKKMKKSKAKCVSLLFRRVWLIFFFSFFFNALEGSSRFGSDEVESKSRKSNKFPLQEEKGTRAKKHTK